MKYLFTLLLLSILSTSYALDPNDGLCGDAYFKASWLYWKLNGDEFNFAGVSREVEGFSEESIHDIKFDWNSGVRLEVGANSPRYGYDFVFDWTHLDATSTSTLDVFGNDSEDVFVYFPPIQGNVSRGPLLADGVARFNSHFTFHYNLYDFEIAKWCECNCCFAFRPHMGLRFADIKQNFKDNVFLNSGIEEDNLHYRSKTRFTGGGIKGGVDAQYCFCGCWTLLAKSSASLLWGRTSIHNHLIEDLGGGRIGSTQLVSLGDIYYKQNYRQTRVIADLAIGVRYETCLSECFPVVLEAMWENNFLFGANRFYVFSNPFNGIVPGGTEPQQPTLAPTTSWKKKGTIAMQGFTLSAILEF